MARQLTQKELAKLERERLTDEQQRRLEWENQNLQGKSKRGWW